MRPSLLRKVARLFGMAQLPKGSVAQLEPEGLLYLEEAVPVSVTLREFIAPGTYCSFRRMGFLGYLARTNERLVLCASFYHRAEINPAFTDPRLGAIKVATERDRLHLRFNAEGLIPDASGEVVLRYRLADPLKVKAILEGKGIGFQAEV